jgi:hypothetical protein
VRFRAGYLIFVESIKESIDVDPYVTQQPNPTTSRAIDYVILGTFRRHELDELDEDMMLFIPFSGGT